MSKEKRDASTTSSLRRYTSSIYVFLMIGLVFYFFISEYERRSSLKNRPTGNIKAVVSNEKAYSGNSPVSHSFKYKYEFDVDGKKYIGISHDEQLKPGDSIEVEYVIENPDKNAPKDYYKK